MYYLFFIALTYSVPVLVLASSFVPLVGIPGVDGEMDFSTYMNALYALSISIAALLAVVKIIIAGVKWMLTDVVTSKGEAKKDIEGALIGLLVVVAAVLILTVINPNLVQLEPFKALTPIDTSVDPDSTIIPGSTAVLESGDTIFSFEGVGIATGAGPTEEVLKNLCENRVETACPTSWFSRSILGYPVAACFEGRYDPVRKICIVPQSAQKLDSFDCERGDPDGNGGRQYVCGAAFAACRRAHGTGSLSSGGSEVNCTY